MASDLAQLLAKVGEQAPDAQRRAAELFAVVERALAHAPEAERESALSSLRELRDSKTTWAGRAQQLQVGYEELSMSINPSLKIAAGVHGAPTALAAAESQAESTSFGPSMCNMLIVEDSSFQAMTMLSLAEESGYNAQVVASAEEALEVLEHNEEINLVLTDVMMDGTRGDASAAGGGSLSSAPAVARVACSSAMRRARAHLIRSAATATATCA